MRILRWISIILLLGATCGVGYFFWQKSRVPTTAAPAIPDEEKRAAAIYDSLGLVDFAIRQAQETQDSVPADLIEEQARLWARYTDLRSRLANNQTESAASSQADSDPLPASLEEPAPTETNAVSDTTSSKAMSSLELSLRKLTGWIWVVAGFAALLLGIFLWLLLRKSRPTRETVTFPKARTLRESLAPWEAPGATPREETPDAEVQRKASKAPPSREETPFPVPDATLPRRTVDPTFAASSWENTRTTPPASSVEPSAMQDMILSLSKRGHTPAEIARRLRLPQDQVSLILKLRQAL
ncbi:MAG: hypothetical protein RL318_555 [Fibrobacterota bacterium]|jgi:cytoskeletal protein RodZ